MVKIFSSQQELLNTLAPGKIKLLIINGKRLALVNVGGHFYAFDNACPHQHEGLHKGMITPFNEITCPLHHYRFSLQTGQEAENRCRPMQTYAIVIREEGVFIDL